MTILRRFFLALTFLCSTAVLAGSPVDINTANAEALASGIQGVGASKAQAIIEYRQQHGPFRSVDELARVPGIGEKTVDKNRANLEAGETTTTAAQGTAAAR